MNSADATTRGVETEAIVAPVRWFDATVRYSYLDAHYDRFVQTVRGAGYRFSAQQD